MKVVFHYSAGPRLAARLAALPGLEVVVCPEEDEAGFAAAMRDADVLWHVLKRCSAAVIAGAPRLKLIQKIGVGVNTIDLPAAAARGIAVCNLPGTNAPAVAEMTLLLMLAVLRRLPRFDAELRAGQWVCAPADQDGLAEPFRHVFTEHPRGDISGAAGWKRYDDADRFARVGLGVQRGGAAQSKGNDGKGEKTWHGVTPRSALSQ